MVSLGRTDDGIDVFMDATAHEAEAVMIVARVKWHTNFEGGIESGLMKMMSIGMGKFDGAHQYHAHAQRLGLEHVIRTAGRRVLQSGKIVGGLAILEDAHHNTAKIEAVAAESMEERDEHHLALVKSWMPRLPCDVDVLVVDEMGKDISGPGMDAKVVNRGPNSEYNAWLGLPTVGRIFVRDLSGGTYGNAVGIGMADVTTDRLVSGIDWEPTRVNALSSGVPARIRVPVHFSTDRECLDWVSRTVGKVDLMTVTYAWIRNTLQLDRLAVSHNLQATIEAQPQVELEGEIDLGWDQQHNLASPFCSA